MSTPAPNAESNWNAIEVPKLGQIKFYFMGARAELNGVLRQSVGVVRRVLKIPKEQAQRIRDEISRLVLQNPADVFCEIGRSNGGVVRLKMHPKDKTARNVFVADARTTTAIFEEEKKKDGEARIRRPAVDEGGILQKFLGVSGKYPLY